ncbi:hypothetical protein D0Z07_2283 [Hyphodiscus hymeniophilus]|uniref:Enoyl-CoA hydratase n=1 Tax=Hyphodiscus hymeniophilus TaxID=353542 RepID=A0A9P6VM42_9HELO|nr:hypothetical protein D0Z07_2283 [Hyphodiscus hymeniophilus]
MAEQYKSFRLSPINETSSAIRLTVSNPPINLVSVTFLQELYTFLTTLSSTADPPKVVVVSSDNPDFWIGHLDLHIASKDHPLPEGVNGGHALHHLGASTQLLGELSTIFIAEVNGLAVAGGNEFALNMDMRFAGPDARFGAVEVGGGLIHVGALQQLTRLIGAGRTAEYMLGATGVDAETAARIGWVNSAFVTAEELRSHVDTLAKRIATFPQDALKFTKLGIRENVAGIGSVGKDLERFKELLGKPDTQTSINRILELSKGEATEFELGLPDSIIQIWE